MSARADSSILYIVMELCEGGDLGAIIKRCRRSRCHLPEETVWSYFAQMAAALDACHNRTASTSTGRAPTQAILHRDLKPENVFLDLEQNVKLGDFGLSKQLGAATFANTYVGTPYYMSPELASGQQYDAKSDIWALGCILYELCALTPPFDASDHAELTRKIKQGCVPSLPRQYSQQLQETVNAMLQLDPRRRPLTRQLLQVKQVKFACRTHELALLHKKVASERDRIAARERELEERERQIDAREASLQTSRRDAARDAVERRASALEERERAVAQSEDACAAFRTELVEQWEAWHREETLKFQGAYAAHAQAVADKDAQIAHLMSQVTAARQPTMPKSPSCSSIPVASRRTAADMPPTPGSRAPADIASPSPKVRLGSRAIASRNLARRVSLNAMRSRMLNSAAQGDGWEDTEHDAKSAADAPAPSPAEAALGRVRRLVAQETSRGDVSDCSMRDASHMWPASASAADDQLSESVQKLQVAPASSTRRDAPPDVATLPPQGMTRTRTVPSAMSALPDEPHWHLLDEAERPSPFLKRVTRVPLESLSGHPALSVPVPPKASESEQPMRFAVGSHDQENASRRPFADVRRRRSSVLRPPGVRTALSATAQSESTRVPARRATMIPRSPSDRTGLRLDAPSPSTRARRNRLSAALQS